MAVERIYEFSTGITYETRNGQWVSTGFTVGEYMNQTIENIPPCVERAIANNLFEVSKNSHSQEPTIVGRVVLGNKAQRELDWSVVAIVTPGADDYQRHTGFYRYFLCKRGDSLWKIVDWIEDYRKKHSSWPVYNPADTKKIGEHTLHDCGRQKQPLQGSWHDFLTQRPAPLIFQPEPNYGLTPLNAMAEYKAKTKSQPTSWAWNVEALEDPRSFLVIQAANQTAYNLLNDMRQSEASQTRPALGFGIDMAGIKRSMNGLIGGGNIKQEWIQTLVQAKKQNQLTPQHWKQIFNDLGANSGSLSANIVRLLTLKAIILPETLPHYLQYLEIKKLGQKPNLQQQISLEFQSQLRAYRNSINDLLSEGAISLAEFIGYYKNMEYVPAVAWLFDEMQPSLWLKDKDTFASEVKYFFKHFSSPRKEYEPLEELLKTWGDRLCISTNLSLPKVEIPSRVSIIREKVENFSVVKRLRSNIFEVVLQGLVLLIFLLLAGNSQTNNAIIDVLFYAIANIMVRVFTNKKQTDSTVRIVGVLLTSVIIVMAILFNDFVKLKSPFQPVVVYAPPTLETPRNSSHPSVLITDEEKQIAISLFDDTENYIQKLVEELSKELGDMNSLSERENQQAKNNLVMAAIRETLDSKNQFDLQDRSVIESEVGRYITKEPYYRDQWIEAIYSYQQSVTGLNEQGFGYIEEGGKTDKALREAIKKNQLFTFGSMTSIALNKIVYEVKLPSGKTLQESNLVIKRIYSILGFQGNYGKAMQGNPQEIKNLIEAIKTYQQNNNQASDGIIEPGGETYQQFKKDLRKN